MEHRGTVDVNPASRVRILAEMQVVVTEAFVIFLTSRENIETLT
jgi:hypothetical protein